MSRQKLVVFDVDGTLIDSQRHIQSAMTEAFASLGLSAPDLPAIRSIVGLSLPEAIALLAPDTGAEVQGRIVQAYKDSFSTLRAQDIAPPYPGALDALGRLSRRDDILLGVATGKSRRGLDHVCRAYGIEGLFVTRQTADDHPSKPHPSMLHAALADTGLDARDAVMVGDTTYDIDMGRAAGLATVGVTWGYHAPDALRRAGADVLADDFASLDAVLEGVFQ